MTSNVGRSYSIVENSSEFFSTDGSITIKSGNYISTSILTKTVIFQLFVGSEKCNA